jgi:hypothetical protein
MELGKENIMKIEIVSAAISVVLVVATLIVSITYYNIKRDEALKSSIESAIVKGIDPKAVRCAYGASDSVCIVYAATKK